MSRWPLRPLNELLARLESGSRPKGGVSGITKGVPSVGGEHLNKEGGFDFDGIKFVPEEFFQQMGRGIIQRQDILVVKDGATTGKTAFVENDFPYARAAINEHVFLLRVNQRLALPRFVFFFLFSPWGQSQILGSFRGAAIGGIPQDFARTVEVPVPSLSEQERIVRILDEAETLRRLRTKADARIADWVPAAFRDHFGDPTHLDKMDWPKRKVGEFADVSYGLADKLDAETSSADGIRILTISNVRLDGSIDTTVERYSLVAESQRAKARLHRWDLLFNWRNGSAEHVGKTALWEEQVSGEILHVSFLLKIRANPSLANPIFLWVLFNRLRSTGFFIRNARMQINRKFNASELSSLELPLPPVDLQNSFAARVAEIRELENAQAVSRKRLDDLFQSLLHRAFQGEL